jgi:hypothetical protein
LDQEDAMLSTRLKHEIILMSAMQRMYCIQAKAVAQRKTYIG